MWALTLLLAGAISPPAFPSQPLSSPPDIHDLRLRGLSAYLGELPSDKAPAIGNISVPAKATEPLPDSPSRLAISSATDKRSFQWGPALRQSAIMLSIQHSYLLATNRWTRYNLRGPFFRDWFRSLKGWSERGWDDGDPFLDNYIAHPLQGALSGYIQVQNDPAYRQVQFGKSGEYWKSRLRAFGWAALHSAQFELGPVSEASIGNLGEYWYIEPETGKYTNGMGQVDLVMTPVGGLGFMMVQDMLERYVVQRIARSGKTRLAKFFAVALEPCRAGANILRAKAPWYRDPAPIVAGRGTK